MIVDRTKAPEIKPMGALHLPEVEVQTLSNGIELRMLDGGAWDLNQLSITWRGGELESSTAVAKLAMPLMQEGAAGLSGSEISEALDFRGANFSANAGLHNCGVKLSSLNSMSDGLLPLLRKIILQPEFPERAFEVYRENAAHACRLNESKVSYLSERALKPLIMGATNPGAQSYTADDVLAVNRDSLVDFHRNIISGAGCKAYLSGRITDALHSEVCEFLESLPAPTHEMSLNLAPFVAMPAQEVGVEKADAMQSAIHIGLPAPLRSHPDYVPLRFTVTALGGYFGSRLMKNIREDKGYTYGISSGLLGRREGSYIMITAQAAAEYVRPLIDEVKRELVRLATEPMQPDELQRLRQYVESSLMDTLDTPFSIMDFYSGMEMLGMPGDYFSRQVEVARNLSAEMIQKMAAKYLRPEEMRVAIAGAGAHRVAETES